MPVVAMHPTEPPSTEGAKQEQAEDSPLYKTDEFRMYCFKVLPCSKRFVHDWTICPFAHPGEKAKRRDPRVFTYTGVACPDMKKCQRGDACPYAHNVFEYWLHPSRYRTQLCNDGIGCKRKVCFFAHTLDELRVSSVKLLPSDIAAGADGSAFDLDPFRVRSEANRKPAAACASMAGNEALVEALRTQQQQQQQAKKTAAALQRSASRGLAAELQQLQQLQAMQQLQAVLANTQGFGGLASQLQQQAPVDSLVSAMMSQLRLGGAPAPQAVLPPLATGGAGLLDAVVQQAVQQVLANNAAQQAAAALMLLQQQQAAAATQQQQQQNQQAAQAQALLEQLLMQQQQQQHNQAAAQFGASGPAPPNHQALQAALAAVMQQQQQAPPMPPMGPVPMGLPHAPGIPADPMPVPMRPGMEPFHGAQHVSPPPSVSSPPLPQIGGPSSVRSSATGMLGVGGLGAAVGSGTLEPGAACGATSDGVPSAAGPPSPRSLTASSSAGSPPMDAPLSSTLSQQAAAAAMSAAATAASYYSQEASRSSFESYRSSELGELGAQWPSMRHCGGPGSGGTARTSLELMHAAHQQHQQQHQAAKFSRAGSMPAPCSPAHDEAMFLHEAHHRQMLLAAAAAQATHGHMPPGCGPHNVGVGMPMGPGAPELDQMAMAAAFATGQCPNLPFGL